MEIDLTRPLMKVKGESERSVNPAETVETARAAARRIGVTLDARVIDTGGLFFVAKLTSDYQKAFPAFARGVRLAGKGPSRNQCLASCFMEFMERVSLYRYSAAERKEHRCLDLREGRVYTLSKVVDLNNTVCTAAGNNYEEAVLHALHELVETRIFGACLFAPHKVVSWDVLSTPYPEWVRDNFLVVKTPSDVPEFHHVTAVQYPRDEQMDIRAADRAVKVDDRLFFSRNPRPLNHHSPASGAAAGLNLESCVQRAIAEVLQGTGGELGGRRRKAVPVGIPVAEPEDVVNYETDSVTGDIRLILKLLGEEVFVGIVDVADPDLQIPVIKLISDYEPRYSLVSQRVLNRFFEGKEV